MIQVTKIDDWLSGRGSPVTLSDHNARITCMRWMFCVFFFFVVDLLLTFLNT